MGGSNPMALSLDEKANAMRLADHWRRFGSKPPVKWALLQESEKDAWRIKAKRALNPTL